MRVPELYDTYKTGTHYMPIIWLSLGDQLIIIGKYFDRFITSNKTI